MMTLKLNLMTSSRNLEISDQALCPICNEPVTGAEASRPFCSPRCKLIDLGQWLDESYRIPVDETEMPSGEGDRGEETS